MGLVVLWHLLSACGDDASMGVDAGRDGGGLDAATDAAADAGGCPTPDRDGDGRRSRECGGDDCDDDDPNRFPGNDEVCDADDHDEDCDDTTFGFRDADSDGVADGACCNMRADGLLCGRDCDDMAPTTSPTSPEVCNGVDDDCDTATDERVLETFFIDADGDDFGSAADGAMTMEACSTPAGYADNRDDCDDASAMVHPAAMERCDGIDNNCDLLTDPGCMCMSGMMRDCGSDVGVCEIGTQTCVDGAWAGCAGGVTGSAESCNGADDDCDGTTDEGVTIDCYPDPDLDDYTAMGATATARCSCLDDQTNRAPGPTTTDCRPMDTGIHPGAAEFCDRIDQNCSIDGGTEPAEDVDDDGFTAIGFAACTGGFPKTDCHDGDDRVFPGQLLFFDEPALAPPADFFDYDCSGINEGPPETAPSCPGPMPLCSTSSCRGGGTSYAGTPCGEETEIGWRCQCVIVPSSSCIVRTTRGTLACH